MEHGMTQVIMQAITFAWTEFNRHPDQIPLIPTIYLNNFEFTFIVYNPERFLVWAKQFVTFINLDIKNKDDVGRYLGFFFCGYY